MDKEERQKHDERLKRLEGVYWLADAPLFINETLVEKMFDAVVRPKYEHILTTEELAKETEETLKAALGIKGEAGLQLPEWLKPIKLSASAEGKFEGEEKDSNKSATISQLKPIWNAERQIEELTRHYLVNYRDRLILNDGPLDAPDWPGGMAWFDGCDRLPKKPPRPLLFLDLEPRVKILPIAAEFMNGNTALLYEDLMERLAKKCGGPFLEFPSDDAPDYIESRQKYWQSFETYFDSAEAMRTVEDAATSRGSRYSWIDFRIPLNEDGHTLHLHVMPAGQADTGVFGYNFVRRGFKHGVRLVGTLKAGLDMNVLAIYDR